MILKIAGCILTVTAASILGIYYSFKGDFRISDLNKMKKALTILISEIEFNMATLEEAMKNISEKSDEPIKNILLEFSRRLENGDGEAAYYVWKEVLEENAEKTYFSKDDLESIISFGKSLGCLDGKMQINNIKLILDYIDGKIERLSEKSIHDKRMYQSLGILSGLIIAVILI